jgi:putative transposase
MISQMKALEDENRRLKRMVADLGMQADLLREALEKKVNRPSIARKANGCTCRWSTLGPSGQIAALSPCRAAEGRDCGGAAGDRHRAGLPVALSGMPERGPSGSAKAAIATAPSWAAGTQRSLIF